MMCIVAVTMSAFIALMRQGFKPLLQTNKGVYTHPKMCVGVGVSATI